MKLPRLPQLQPREQLLAVGSGVVLLMVILDRLVMSPWFHHARKVREDIVRMEEAIQTHGRLLARRELILAEIGRYQRYLTPPPADELQMAALVKEIEALATQSHVRLQESGEIKPLATEREESVTRYTLELKFDCTLEEWAEFIYRLETSPALFTVVRGALSVQEETPDLLKGSLRVVSESITFAKRKL